MKTILLVLLAVALTTVVQARDFRDLTNKSGATIQAEILDMNEGVVKIRAKGQVHEVPLDTLSDEDQKWLTEWDLKRKGNGETLYYSEVIFEDDFSGDGFGERWGHYKSESVITDGVLIGKTIDINDHAGVDSIRFEGRQDMEVAVKFKFAGPEAERFNVWFDDKDFTGAHAGHVCSVSISPTGVNVADAKTGNMANSIYEMKKSAAGLDEATKELLATKSANFPIDIEKKKDEWHELLIRTKGSTVSVLIDGEAVGEFESEGIGHETKSLVSLTTNINDVHYDDFAIKAAPASGKSGEAK